MTQPVHVGGAQVRYGGDPLLIMAMGQPSHSAGPVRRPRQCPGCKAAGGNDDRCTLDREAGDQAHWIIQVRKFSRLAWLVPARPQPGAPTGLTVDPGGGLNFAPAPCHPAEQARGAT